MYKHIGLLRQPDWHDNAGTSHGFMLNGNSSLQSLAQFYGLRPPATEPRMTVADYLAQTCYGQPCVGDRTVWDRVELIVEEIRNQAISKVRIAILPLHERRAPGAGVGAPRDRSRWHDRRRPERSDAWQ